MCILRSHKTKVLWGVALIVAQLFTGCAGIEPYQPRDYREEGMEKGLFSGPEGEFVIFRKAGELETGHEEKKIEVKSGEQ
jgi:hypothetical protein